MSDIRYDDDEPVYQHQVERDKINEQTQPRTVLCTDPTCAIKLPGHHHRVNRQLAALKVIALTPHIRAYLAEKDPMALRQVEGAIRAAGSSFVIAHKNLPEGNEVLHRALTTPPGRIRLCPTCNKELTGSQCPDCQTEWYVEVSDRDPDDDHHADHEADAERAERALDDSMGK